MRWEISNSLHAGDVIYERLSFTYGCVKLRVLSEPVETVLDDMTKTWDFNPLQSEKAPSPRSNSFGGNCNSEILV